MTSEELWARMVAAESAYYSARGELFRSGDYVDQIRRVLKGNREVESALRALSDAPTEMLEQVVHEMFPQAANYLPKTSIGLDNLSRLDPKWLSAKLPALIDEFLAQPQTDYFQFRLLAIVLDKLEQPAALNIVIERAAQSSDPEIRDEVPDFLAYRTARHS